MPRKNRVRQLALPAGTQLPTRVPRPVGEYPYWERLQLLPGRRHHYILWSAELLSMEHHWTGGDTVPCVSGLGLTCDYCRPAVEGGRRRCWNGYLVGIEEGKTSPFRILTLTPGAVSHCDALERRQDLAGYRLSLERQGTHRRGAVRCWLSLNRHTEIVTTKIVNPSELQRVILNIWGVQFAPKAQELKSETT